MSPVALRPGHQVNLKTNPPSRTEPTDTGTAFFVGFAEKGDPLAPVLIRNMNDYQTYFGNRVAIGALYDAADTFFREGGSRLYLMRVVGPTPVRASIVLKDNAAANTLTVTAKNAGAWGLQLRIAVVAGVAPGSVQIVVTDLATGTVLEQSPDCLTKQDIITWSSTSVYVTATDTGPSVLMPVAAAAATMTGAATGDETNAVDAQWTAALGFISTIYGPGQVAMPGRTTDPAHTALIAHAKANNRMALLDVADSATVATLQTSALTSRATNDGQYAAMFAPFLTIPGLAPNTVRVIAPSSFVAALMARVDATDGPATPAAGDAGQANYVIGTNFAYTDAQRDTLNTTGINVIRSMLSGVRLYGYRTLTDPVANPNWVQLNHARLYMSIYALAGNVLESHTFRKMDGRGIEFGRLDSDINAMLQPFWGDGSLYGDSAGESFSIDTSIAVNTPAEQLLGNLHALIALRMSPFAELVILDVVKVPITQSL